MKVYNVRLIPEDIWEKTPAMVRVSINGHEYGFSNFRYEEGELLFDVINEDVVTPYAPEES